MTGAEVAVVGLLALWAFTTACAVAIWGIYSLISFTVQNALVFKRKKGNNKT